MISQRFQPWSARVAQPTLPLCYILIDPLMFSCVYALLECLIALVEGTRGLAD